METVEESKTPWWFWLASGLALVWNLLGVGAYITDVRMSHEDMVNAYGQVLADAAAAQPAWVTGAYAIAVFAGALGCLLLLLRKKLAIMVLLLSLIAVILQQGYMWFGSNVMSEVPSGNKAMYISIPIIAVLLVWFARRMTARNILK